MTRRNEMTNEPEGVRDGDVAGFDAFLDWIIDRGDVQAVAASTLLMIRVTWRTVNRQLQLAARHNVVDMSPQQIIDSYVSGRGGDLRSRDTYVSRLRCGLNLYQAFLSNAPDWRTARPTDVQRRVAVRQRAKTAPTRVVSFPLRPNLNLAFELPNDLRREEADLIAAWLAGFTAR
jgi:hypothetical protein